ncbi:MAG: primary-amine oxidase [Pseudonocardiales bacterium]|nr:primary-amine oxidase [Pseudonocardiales bacterium]
MTVSTTAPTHPLDPLTEAEFRQVQQILRRERDVARPAWRIASVELLEPAKDVVRAYRPGDPVDRAARVVLWNTGDGTAYVTVLSLTGDKVVSWDAQPGRQPNATIDEWTDCDTAMRAHPDVVAALAARGVTDLDLVLVDMWTFGAHLVPPAYADRRIGWCDVWVRGGHDTNPYAHPVSGLKLVVDLNTMELLEIEAGDIPGGPGGGFPDVQGEYVPRHVPGLLERTDRKPLEVVQPDGVSFTVDGHDLAWQKWRMRIGFTYREGLVLHTVGYDGRSVAHRMSFAEMVVPYRDPSPDHVRRTAYDIGEWGLGFMTTPLELGCDCLGEITYLDAVLHDSAGEPKVIRNAICVHEEDNGVLWKHVDSRAGAEVRRMRRLVVSFHVTVANYEYLVYWRFYEDGSIESEVRATGIMVTTPFDGDTAPPYGTVVDRQTYAPIHQHFIVARLDMEVDGPDNTVVMSETAQPPIGPDNPHGLALTQRTVPLRTEDEGRQDYDWSTQRAWKVTNPNRRNKVGAPVAYKLVPGAAIPPMLDPSSPVFRRAQVLGHTLWVTPFDAAQRWPCGEFVNQSDPDDNGDDGLPVWTAANRSIENTDVVLWYVFGIHHVPRVEDWPVMPADTVSFWLKPAGFFDANPALDVAPSGPDHCSGS